MFNENCEISHLGGAVVLFSDAVRIDSERVIPLLESLKEDARSKMFTIIKDDSGKPIHAINQGGFIYDIENIMKAPVRITGLTDQFFHECEKALYQALLRYIEMFPAILQSLWWKTAGHVLAYDEGASLGFHSDNDVNYRYGFFPEKEHATRNVLSALIYLNDCVEEDDEEKEHSFAGGHMTIPYFGVDIKPKTGDICMMPANYLGAHEILKVTRGTRYSYLSWYAQGSEAPEKGVDPKIEEEDAEVVGGQYWLTTVIDDYEKYVRSKYEDQSQIPEHLLLSLGRPKDHEK